MKIPFVDLKKQYCSLKPEIDAAVIRVLESAQYVLGQEVAAFEAEFAAFAGAPYGVAVNSGTSALHLAMLAAGLGPGDEVITTPFTFVATVAAIEYAGARPVFVDIDTHTYTLDPEAVEQAITDHTRAIVPVHLYGQPADMDAIVEIARRHNLVAIEDAAQAHGAEYKGRRVGSLSDIGCFSFYPSKNLGACGEGGMIVTHNPEYASTVRMLRDWGQEQKYQHVRRGYNYRMEGLQGAILRVKLRHLEEWTEARRNHAAQYSRLMARNGVGIPYERQDACHVYHVYAIRSAKRDALKQRLESLGIQTGIHYPYPVHLLPAYTDLGYSAGAFPAAEQAAKEVLSLPMYPELSPSQIDFVAAAVGEAMAI